MYLSRAELELVKARLMKTHDLPGASELDLDVFEAQVQAFAGRVREAEEDAAIALRGVDARQTACESASCSSEHAMGACAMECGGSLPREAIARVINEHLSEVQYCYEMRLLQDPTTQGTVRLEWTIETDGSVGRIRQRSRSCSTHALATCIMQRMERWRFSEPSGGVAVVSYPFIFIGRPSRWDRG